MVDYITSFGEGETMVSDSSSSFRIFSARASCKACAFKALIAMMVANDEVMVCCVSGPCLFRGYRVDYAVVCVVVAIVGR